MSVVLGPTYLVNECKLSWFHHVFMTGCQNIAYSVAGVMSDISPVWSVRRCDQSGVVPALSFRNELESSWRRRLPGHYGSWFKTWIGRITVRIDRRDCCILSTSTFFSKYVHTKFGLIWIILPTIVDVLYWRQLMISLCSRGNLTWVCCPCISSIMTSSSRLFLIYSISWYTVYHYQIVRHHNTVCTCISNSYHIMYYIARYICQRHKPFMYIQ
jgi:hypothetical protein